MTLTVTEEQGEIWQLATIFNDQVYPAGGPNQTWPNGLRASRLGMEERAAYLSVDRRESDATLRSMIRDLLGVSTIPLSVIALGDSITAGHNSADKTGYCGYLTDLLDRRVNPVTATFDRTGAIDGVGLSGLATATTAVLAANTTADIALLMVGTNDASHTVANTPGSSWQTSYGNLVDQILASSPTIKVVCGRTALAGVGAAGYTATFHANQLLINTYVDNVVAARLSGGRVVKADMSTVPCSWLTDSSCPDWHPGDAGYLRIAHTFLDAISPWLP